MKYLPQIILIVLFSFLGELLHFLIPIPIPASIYGMVLLFLALSLKIIPVKAVKETGSFFTSLLPLLFVGPIVSLLDHWEHLKDNLIPMLLIVLVSTVVVFAVSGWVTGLIIKSRKGDKDDA